MKSFLVIFNIRRRRKQTSFDISFLTSASRFCQHKARDIINRNNAKSSSSLVGGLCTNLSHYLYF